MIGDLILLGLGAVPAFLMGMIIGVERYRARLRRAAAAAPRDQIALATLERLVRIDRGGRL